MVDGGANRLDPEDRLAESRKQFVTTLGERMQVLSAALESLVAAPGEALRRGSFQRRVHALGAACATLGFSDAQAAIERIESLIAELENPDRDGRLEKIARLLDMVPAMVLGGDAPLSIPPPATVDAPAPISAIFFGLGSLASGFEAKGSSWEVRSVDSSDAVSLALREAAPDVLIVDAAVPQALQVVEQVLSEAGYESLRVVVIGAFERPEAAAAFLHAGVHRVLPKPVSPSSLERHVRELCQQNARSLQLPPLGELTLDELVARIQQELRRGLVDSVRPGARETSIPFGAGVEELAAVWGAVARMRELIALRSGGAIHFDAGGPEGAIALAPWAAGERYASASPPRGEAPVSLSGRRVIVADDDPAVVWFVGGVLREAGAQVSEAADGLAALEQAYEVWPDLIVSDLLMPELDGFELCRRIKRDLLLSDVPVIVLSWKEDLLQRVRELGAGADGYLQKEANGSVITRSVREVLHARARIEERFRKNPEVRGRLDSVAPRLVIELAAKLLGNASVALRDAAYLYELELRSGRVVSVQRTDIEGRSQQGVELLGPLLGVRVGRFVVRRSSKLVTPMVDEALSVLAKEAGTRARAAQSLLCAPALSNVGRVVIAEERVAAYLSLSPTKVRSLAQELIAGERPAEIGKLYGERLLESLLQDLVLHDGIVEVHDLTGQALLKASLGARPARPSVSPRSVRSSNAPASTGSRAAGVGFTAPKGDAHKPAQGSVPLAAIALRSVPASSLGSGSPVMGATVDLAPPHATQRGDAPPPASSGRTPPPLPRFSARPTATAAVDTGQAQAASRPPRPDPRPAPSASAPVTPARDSEPMLELGEALIEQLLDESAEAQGEAIELRARKSSPSFPGAAPAVAAVAPVITSTGYEPVRPPVSARRPGYTASSPLEESPMDGMLQTLTDADADAEEAVSSDDDVAPSDAAPIILPAAQEPAPTSTRRVAAQQASSSQRGTLESAAQRKPGRKRAARFPLLGVLIAATAGALVFTLLMVFAGSNDEEPEPPRPKAGSRAAEATQVSPVAAEPTSQPAPSTSANGLVVSDRELPAEIMLSAGKGLLEVSTGDKHRIYVDGVFVGPGPLRRVPLTPGAHEVRISLDGVERATTAEVRSNRRTLVEQPSNSP